MRAPFMIAALIALPAAALAGDELSAPARASVAFGAGPLLYDSGVSGNLGLSYALFPQLAATADLQGAVNRGGDTALMASAGLRATLLPRAGVSPYILANYGLGHVYQDSGRAIQVGAGLNARIDGRWTAFVEARFAAIDVIGGDDPYFELPLRAGVRLSLP